MSGVPCKQLRAVTSVYKQLRAFASVFERARSRLVAFSRVWSRLVALLFFCSSNCMHLRAFASVCERVRARQVAFSRVWSRLVAFSRAYFFSCSGTFGRVLSSFFVIFRHSSSQNSFFGYGGQRAVAAAAGQGGQQFAAHGSGTGAGCASCHDIRFKLLCNCGRAAAALVRVANNCTAESGSLQFVVLPGVQPRLLCVK